MSKDSFDPQDIPTISEEATSLGNIRINHSVVANIVRLAALEVDGIVSVGGGFVSGIREIFRGKESEHGVHVSENEGEQYVIEVRVVMRFGVELAKVALLAQENIGEQVKRMTMKEVAQVDVIIDGVRTGEDIEKPADDWSEATQ